LQPREEGRGSKGRKGSKKRNQTKEIDSGGVGLVGIGWGKGWVVLVWGSEQEDWRMQERIHTHE
jgi:hypothetical protein